MRWTVEGADQQSGKDFSLTIEAPNVNAATEIARSRGLLVSDVKPAGETTLNYRDPNQPAGGFYSGKPARSADDNRAPEYMGLRVGASILFMFAAIYYFLAIALIVAAIIVAGNKQAIDALSGVGGFSLFIFSLGPAMIGALLHAASELCLAVRDIARNSFHK